MVSLKIWKTHNSIKLPMHMTQQSACFDLAFQGAGKTEVTGYTKSNKPVKRLFAGSLTLSPGDRILVPTGLIMDIPEGYSVRLHARSGMSLKQGLVLANAEGVIDSDYIDEVFVMLHNISENSITIHEGDRIAQAELVKNVEYNIEQTSLRPLPKSNRMGGLGSTGISHDKGIVIINTPVIVDENKPEKRGRGRPKKLATNSP
jgi:dUTP pyrophosphatase